MKSKLLYLPDIKPSMTHILTSFFFFVTIVSYAQVNDDFSDGDFSNNPNWAGDIDSFQVDINSRLQLNAPSVSDDMYLSTSNSMVDNQEWTFLVNLDFNPSSANLARVYLMSDQADLKGSLNGYFVQIGGTADEVSLYRQSGTNITEVIDGIDDVVDSNPVNLRVRVTRTIAGDWTLSADNTGGSNYASQGVVTDNTHTLATHFGVACIYTSTRSDRFFFDDFTTVPMTILDTVPPEIVSVDVISDQTLRLFYSENVTTQTAENTANYSVDNGIGSPTSAVLASSNSQAVELTFSNSFQVALNYELVSQNIADDSANIMLADSINFIYDPPFFANYKDVVFTEIMADPTPVAGLPEAEYLELYNNTNHTISLENWTISDGSTTITLTNFAFLSGTYLLCYDPAGSVSFGQFNAIETSLPTLNNGADVVVLRDNNGVVVDSVAYTIGWYNSIQKALGGWSLELRNPNSPCHDPGNWSASENIIGGTPGTQNSIFTDLPNTILPVITSASLDNDSTIGFQFDKNIIAGTVVSNPTTNLNFTIEADEIVVTLSNIDPKLVYQITLSGFADCWGNTMVDYTYLFAIPEKPEAGDIVINEILFNPTSEGTDYIELVNVSDRILSLSNLQLANINDGMIDNLKPLAEDQILWFPNEYLVLTEDSLAVIATFPNYQAGRFLEMDLPQFNNDSSTVILLSDVDKVIDKVAYTEDWHFALIDDLNGKALERLSFNQPSQSADNWHSAAEVEGWGTPGYLNSQASNPSSVKTVEISQAIFSPDNDGYQDVLEITYQFDNPDNVMDVVVYNAFGQPVRELKDNFFPGQTGSIKWDGITDEGTKANVGTYVIAVTVFDLEGNIDRYQLVGVLAARL